jgi:transcriptional regulator with GAF, ATPase, and Fis domain
VESTNTGFHKRKREVDRLIDNWTALLDNMLELVILIRNDKTIEFMNRNAISVFGDLRNQKCHDHLCFDGNRCENNCPVKLVSSGKNHSDIQETRIGDIYVSFSSVAFRGYRGDTLIMLMMRDVTKRVQQQRELAEFHENLEEILKEKIFELRETEKVRKQLSQQVNVLQSKLQRRNHTDEMIGSSRKMRELRDMVDQVADSDATILITGESGTGKELVANLIQRCSHRSDKPFLKVNCNAINDSLLESDLFGHEKGAFTGAVSQQKGKFEIVNGGTLFLDEIGDISSRMQAALLRVLQNGEIIRVGGNKAFTVDVRIIAATNVDLAKLVQDGNFRLDLFYRLNIININIPPLRERKDDLVDLATHFVKHYRRAFKKNIDFLPDSIIQRLLKHDWPGNVRELENVIQRAVLMAKDSVVTERDIYIGETGTVSSSSDYLEQVCVQFGQKSLKELTSDFEKEVIVQCFKKNNANVIEVASELKLGKTALYSKMKRYGLRLKMLKKM